MNRKNWFLGIALFSLLFTSCGSNEEKGQSEEVKEEVVVESCLYTYNSDSSKVSWTAFKTTDHIGVGGRFDSVIVVMPDSMQSAKEALENVSFTIFSTSVFTNNSIRDNTLRKFFFSKLANDGNIEGSVKIVEGDNTSGGGTVELTINDVKRDIGFKYTIVDGVINLKTKITLNSFNGQDAVKSLNVKCDDLHKGADGISKLWPDVEIEVKAVLNKDC